MGFRVRMAYEKEDFYAFGDAVVYGNRWSRGLSVLSRGCFLLAGGMFLLMGGTGVFTWFRFLFQGEPQGRMIGVYAGMAGVSVAFLLLGIAMIRRRSRNAIGWTNWRRYRRKKTELEYEFQETCFWEHTPDSDHRMDYTVIQYVAEDRGHYFLFVSKGVAHILCKSGFLTGDPEAFGAWIGEKLGKETVKIR